MCAFYRFTLCLMQLDLATELDAFIERFETERQSSTSSTRVEYDPDWPSPCYRETGSPGDWVEWKPVAQQPSGDLKKVEQGLEIIIPESLHVFFGRYFSDNIAAKTERGNLELLFPWNEEDFERLQQNLIGHVLMKRRLGQPETLFFAVTDEEDFILSIEIDTGAVVLEQVGLLPKETLAPDLATFVSSLKPLMD